MTPSVYPMFKYAVHFQECIFQCETKQEMQILADDISANISEVERKLDVPQQKDGS